MVRWSPSRGRNRNQRDYDYDYDCDYTGFGQSRRGTGSKECALSGVNGKAKEGKMGWFGCQEELGTLEKESEDGQVLGS